MQRIETADRHGAALHVGVHVEHAFVRLQVRAAGIEANAFADETQIGWRCGARGAGARVAAPPIREVHDARVARRVAAGYGKECLGAESPQSRLAVEGEFEFEPACEFLEQAPIGARIELVRRQRRQPAREVVAGGRRDAAVEIGAVQRSGEVDASQAHTRLRFALEACQGKCRGLQRRDRGEQCLGAAGAEQQQRLRLGLERRSCEFSRELQSLENGGLRRHQPDDQQGVGLGADPQFERIAGFSGFEPVDLAQQASKRQCVPCGVARRGRQQHNCTRIAHEPRGRDPGAYFVHGRR